MDRNVAWCLLTSWDAGALPEVACVHRPDLGHDFSTTIPDRPDVGVSTSLRTPLNAIWNQLIPWGQLDKPDPEPYKWSRFRYPERTSLLMYPAGHGSGPHPGLHASPTGPTPTRRREVDTLMKLTDMAHDRLSGLYPALADHGPARSTSVCLLTLNEAEHIGRSLDLLAPALDDGTIDDLWVADGGSTDGTRDIVQSAGVNLICLEEILPGFGPVLGKGDSMWRAMSVLPGDVMVFLDADIDGDLAGAAGKLATPIQQDGSTHFVKGYFTRQHQPSTTPVDTPLVGGRVTETVARPLIAQLAPWLSPIREPLSGQVAMSRDFAMATPVVTSYGLEIAMLFDAAMTLGVDNIAQVDIGEILNPRKPGSDLDDMGAEVASTLAQRVIACHGDPDIEARIGHLVTRRLPQRPPMGSVIG